MKKPFSLPHMLKRIEDATRPYPKAALFELHVRGYTSLFEQLVACIISIRTLDEITIPVAEKLFGNARTPAQMLQFSAGELAEILHGSQYPGQKATTLLAIARAAVDAFGGALPADYNQLIALKGVGPKCAKLALGIAANHPGISVDVHVHRVTNRWGLVQTKTPEATMDALEEIVPSQKWIHINRLLMPFGKHICVLRSPFCTTCPVLDYCRQVDVNRHR